MEMHVVGVENVDYVSRKTGNSVKGIKFHCTSKNSHVEGLACESFFVGSRSQAYDDADKIPPDCDIDITFDRWGSVDSIEMIDD